MEIKSITRFSGSTPDKIRILSKLIVGKSYPVALAQLEFSGRQASKTLILLLKQARDQVKDEILNDEELRVKELRVDEGPKLKRRRIRHQGRATAILKRMAHASVVLVAEDKNKAKKTEGNDHGAKS
jgi:large subunit ribosomal protein L22